MGGCDRRRAHGAGHVDDAAIWEAGNGGYRHAVTGIHLDQRCAEIDGLSVSFEPMHGPERRPSDTLAELPDNGWVCLTSVLALDVVDGLEQGGCVGRADRDIRLSRAPAVSAYRPMAASEVGPG